MITRPSSTMLVVTPRRRGRPRLAEPGGSVSVWLPARVHDALIRLAEKQDVSVSSFAGRVLTGAIDRQRGS